METASLLGRYRLLDMILNLITQTHGAALAAEISDQLIPTSRAVRPPAHGTTFPPRG